MTSTESAGTDTGAPGPSGVRPTRQRRAILGAVESVDDFRTAQDLHGLLRDRGERVGLATVYRTLQLMADAGDVDALRTEGGEVAYRRCSGSHHHHLVCRRCGATVEIEGPAVERWTEAVASEHGFREVSHTLELFGTCRICDEAAG
ncbi:Fur family transcriptional regulator [Nocardioides sp. R-C-SC26]|uniref:Fur family transcriptional regulator n=1 Tax=Nocardioides sp. R-C-SC26 TaxID=2870414 RepID=UPI001E353DE0|nr:Fur family transcriptional regulator [Nocardioides sp. R-C-SC26]